MLNQANELSLTQDAKIEPTTQASDIDTFDPEDHEAAVRRAAGGNTQGSFERITKGLV